MSLLVLPGVDPAHEGSNVDGIKGLSVGEPIEVASSDQEDRVRRKRTKKKARERRTVIPAFDPQQLAKEIEEGASRTTIKPPFDPTSYARMVEEHVSATGAPGDSAWTLAAAMAAPHVAETVRTLEATRSTTPAPLVTMEDTLDVTDAETIGREMYSCYLASEFPEALVLAERVLETQPDHALAQVVAETCREQLRALTPSSILRLKATELERHANHIDATSSFVLGHVDGVSDAATVAALTGLPGAEALDRIHALVDLGVLEVVGG